MCVAHPRRRILAFSTLTLLLLATDIKTAKGCPGKVLGDLFLEIRVYNPNFEEVLSK